MTANYKMRQVLLQNATTILLQNAAEVYYKMHPVFYYKMRQLLHIAAILLQNLTVNTNATFITNCDSTHTRKIITENVIFHDLYMSKYVQ